MVWCVLSILFVDAVMARYLTCPMLVSFSLHVTLRYTKEACRVAGWVGWGVARFLSEG